MSEVKKMDDVEAIENLSKAFDAIKKEIAKVIIGQENIIEQLLISLFAKGHCLLVGVPGLAKTLMIKTLADVLNLQFSRIQFTPDLMPSDITGTEIIEDDLSTGKKSFRFIKGPIFANIILADEINRTPPKTQSALLEAMQEYNVTTAGETHVLEQPFFVLATQNPIEHEGTYPLPEAQLDRFMFNLWLDYPTLEEEKRIVSLTTGLELNQVDKILNHNEIIQFQELTRKVPVAQNVIDYAVNLVTATRPDKENKLKYINDWIRWGAGPRASQYLILAAKVRAALLGKITPDLIDIKETAHSVLRHRLVITYHAEAENITVADIINRLIEEVV